MGIIYNDTKKDLASEKLHRLFMSVGWSDGSETSDMIKNYNTPFVNFTLVISAWENERLIGAVWVLSDKMFRSIIYDLLNLPDFQNKGIVKELVKRCIEHFPTFDTIPGDSESNSLKWYNKEELESATDIQHNILIMANEALELLGEK
jgi:hypothetical protein